MWGPHHPFFKDSAGVAGQRGELNCSRLQPVLQKPGKRASAELLLAAGEVGTEFTKMFCFVELQLTVKPSLKTTRKALHDALETNLFSPASGCVGL